jgi:hypothetical protein
MDGKHELGRPRATISSVVRTVIATFDRNGRYTGHAALYLGQDKHGIRVIDQWNIRESGRVTGQHLPSERTLHFDGPRRARIDRERFYNVVEQDTCNVSCRRVVGRGCAGTHRNSRNWVPTNARRQDSQRRRAEWGRLRIRAKITDKRADAWSAACVVLKATFLFRPSRRAAAADRATAGGRSCRGRIARSDGYACGHRG